MAESAEELRYERKFVLENVPLATTELHVKLNPALFSPIYQERAVNNIYLDSAGLEYYFNNLNGAPGRHKARIRWYGDLCGQIGKPVLELKIKSGLLGHKLSFPLKPFLLEEGFSPAMISQVLDESDMPANIHEQMRYLSPALINRYRRRYYLSADKEYRMTVDWDLEFYGVRNPANLLLHRAAARQIRVLELKYARERSPETARILRHLPFRLTRMSKYVLGMEALYSQ